VYTPVEVVDFIIQSVNHVLETEFRQTLGSKGVHIIDPFTGTGTFVTRLLQSGLIRQDELEYKYRNEIHANEIVLLAYYIAAINIEAVYHSIRGGKYRPFEGICLTDTFELYEKEDLLSALLVDNSARRKRQKKLDIRVVMGNPPYSVGQASANDNNQNFAYPLLDERITETYGLRTNAVLSKGLYDSYIRAIRWASDRIGDSGVIGFVTNAGFLEAGTADGLRMCLAEEFSSIYIFNLRGNQSTTMGELSRKEGGKIFGSGSRTPIAISILIKNPESSDRGRIFYHDIGDYLSRETKLEMIQSFGSIKGIAAEKGWKTLIPDQHGDWLKQRDDRFGDFLPMGDKKNSSVAIFKNYSLGIVTNRDAWCYNFSAEELSANMARMINFYNDEVRRFDDTYSHLDKKEREAVVDGFLNTDTTKISWTRGLKQELVKSRTFKFESGSITQAMYRPFMRQYLYYSRRFNEMILQMPKIFPHSPAKNRVIWITGIGTPLAFTCFMSDVLPDLQGPAKNQCFPLYLYEEGALDPEPQANRSGSLFDQPIAPSPKQRCTSAITDEALNLFRSAYPGVQMEAEDVFYYVYGILHSADYRKRYADNLSRELPRIPCVQSVHDFLEFARCGRELAELHIGFEQAPMYPLQIEATAPLSDGDYRVEKMRYGKKGGVKDLTTIHYNGKITVRGIPLDAYDFVINGKPAIDWVMERQRVSEDRDSGLTNDANTWARVTVKNVRYPLELLQRVVTVSLETLRITKALPDLVVKPLV
jgi:predicted helicase